MTDTPTQTTDTSLHATDLPVTLELLQTRKQFEKIIFTILQNSTSQKLYEWRTREWIENQIKEIEEIEISQKYRVKEILGIKVLRIARNVRGKNLQIIPVEDYFDVIYAAHIFTGHGGIAQLKEYLENRKLYLPLKALTCFLKLCEACNAVRSQNPVLFKTYQGFLELIDLSDTPDGEMKFVMHYRALKLRRVFLRPLNSSNAPGVAEQLLELFGHIGPPHVLYTPTISFTKALILRLAIINPDFKIICGRAMDLKEKTKDIKANLIKWMTCNKSNEWSKGISCMTGYDIRRRQLKLTNESEEFAIDKNLPGPSSMHQDTILKKRANESYLQKNLSADEVLHLLNPNKTYNKIIPQAIYQYTKYIQNIPIPQKQVEAPQILKKVYKTYTRTKKEKSLIIVPTDDNKEEPHGKRALCINTNLRHIVMKPTKCIKKFKHVCNSTLDLPDQTATKVKTIIGINIMDSMNFGTIPKESCDLHTDILHNKVGQLSLPYKDSDALGSKNIKDFSNLESTEEIKEMLHFEFEDFNEEKPCLEDPVDFSALESKYILESKEIKKEPLSFETSTGCNALKNNGIKEEEEDFGTIVKVESLVE